MYYYTFDTKRYSIVNKRKALKSATLQDLIDFTRELRENSYFKLHAEGNFHKSQIESLYRLVATRKSDWATEKMISIVTSSKNSM